jgi:hypothetical protein
MTIGIQVDVLRDCCLKKYNALAQGEVQLFSIKPITGGLLNGLAINRVDAPSGKEKSLGEA